MGLPGNDVCDPRRDRGSRRRSVIWHCGFNIPSSGGSGVTATRHRHYRQRHRPDLLPDIELDRGPLSPSLSDAFPISDRGGSSRGIATGLCSGGRKGGYGSATGSRLLSDVVSAALLKAIAGPSEVANLAYSLGRGNEAGRVRDKRAVATLLLFPQVLEKRLEIAIESSCIMLPCLTNLIHNWVCP